MALRNQCQSISNTNNDSETTQFPVYGFFKWQLRSLELWSTVSWGSQRIELYLNNIKKKIDRRWGERPSELWLRSVCVMWRHGSRIAVHSVESIEQRWHDNDDGYCDWVNRTKTNNRRSQVKGSGGRWKFSTFDLVKRLFDPEWQHWSLRRRQIFAVGIFLRKISILNVC